MFSIVLILGSGALVACSPTLAIVQAIAFPLRWLAGGMRSVFLPDSFKTLERGDSWNLGWTALVLAIWLVVGLVAARVTFRWIRKDS